jgi:hypothetical protein
VGASSPRAMKRVPATQSRASSQNTTMSVTGMGRVAMVAPMTARATAEAVVPISTARMARVPM